MSVVTRRAAGPLPERARPSRRLVAGCVALAALTLAGAGASTWVTLAGPGAHPAVDRTAAARTAAVSAATQAVTDFTTYDYRTVDRDFARVAKLATGGFGSDFAKGSAYLKKLIVAGKATSKGTVVAAGAELVSPAHAVVLLAVDDKITNSKVSGQATKRYRFRVTVDKVDGAWRVSALDPVA